jgi:hypothetical protein
MEISDDYIEPKLNNRWLVIRSMPTHHHPMILGYVTINAAIPVAQEWRASFHNLMV